MKKQPYEVAVKMTSGRKHLIKINARSATAAFRELIRKLQPYEIHSLRTRAPQ